MKGVTIIDCTNDLSEELSGDVFFEFRMSNNEINDLQVSEHCNFTDIGRQHDGFNSLENNVPLLHLHIP